MLYTSEQLLKKIADALASLPYDRNLPGLYDPIKYVLSLGGKRIRPVLMLMAYNLYKDDVEHIIMPALGLETYHNFTLLHDDLMDRAEVRRGKPTVHKVWNDCTAILSGDTMTILAYQRICQCDEKYLPAALKLFSTTAIEIGEGQQYDMDFESRNDVTEDEYIEMIRLKTSVLLACALKMGAILGGAPTADADALYSFGEKLGLAFQLQDDFLDVYGDFKVFGKKIGGDILCNKKTYMLINALQRANEAQRMELTQWISAKEYDPDEKISAVTRLYNEIGIPALANAKIKTYFEEAEKALACVKLSDEKKQVLWDYALKMMNRQS